MKRHVLSESSFTGFDGSALGRYRWTGSGYIFLANGWLGPAPAFMENPAVTQSAKKLLQDTLEGLPEDATVEEAMERLLFLAKIEQGLAEADAGKTLNHDEVRKRLSL